MENNLILCFEWESKGRDIHLVEPVFSYLEHVYKYRVERHTIYNAITKILFSKPILVILPSSVGALENFKLSKLCHLIGINCVAFTNEGDYINTRIDSFFWGWNTDKVIYEDILFLWSDRTKNYIEGFLDLPKKEFNEKIKVVGNTGFDRYKILNFKPKKFYLQYRPYKFIFLITAYGFDFFSEENLMKIRKDKKLANSIDDNYIKKSNFFLKSKTLLNKIFRRLINENMDTLFILKCHPAMEDFSETEFDGLEKLENIQVIWKEEEISDLINACDLLLTFDSTTCLEAWLLKKTTILINPISSDFDRSIISNGSPIYKNFNETQNAISEFKSSGKIKAFEKKESLRKEITKSIIQFADGKNHYRAAKIIDDFVKKGKSKPFKLNTKMILLISKEILKKILLGVPFRFFFSKYYKSHMNLKSRFCYKERMVLTNIYKSKILELNERGFYKKNN